MTEPGMSRAAIVNVIETDGPQTVRELAGRLGLSVEYVRHAVVAMVADGTVVPVGTVPRASRGPSEWLYGTKKQAATYANRLATLEAKIEMLEKVVLYGINQGAG